MNLSKSSITNDQSELSIFLAQPKNDAQLRCQQLLKQSSEYRCTIRELKHDNQWLKTTNQGLQSQCSVLKDLLRQQKDIIAECNSDLRMANEQINRLEDCLHSTSSQLTKLQTIISHKQTQIDSNRKTISQLQSQLSSLRTKLQTLQTNYETQKRQQATKQHQLSQHLFQKLQSTLHHTPPSTINQHHLKQLISKIQHITLKDVNQKIQLISQIYQKLLSKQHQQSISSKLQSQLKQATDLVQQFQIQNSKNNIIIKQLSQKSQISQKSIETYHQQSLLHKYTIEKLIQLIISFSKASQQPLNKLKQCVSSGNRKFQLDLILQQLHPLLNDRKQDKYKITQLNKQWEAKLQVSEQRFHVLQLKHSTLRRQFEGVMEDNRRILKSHQLSRFRAERNGQHFGREKQNNSNILNTTELVCKK